MQVLVSLWGCCAGMKIAVGRASARAGCRAVARLRTVVCGLAAAWPGCWWLPADGISLQRDVDDEDRAGQHPGHLDQQHRELPQPDLELGLELPLPQAPGDPAELRVAAGRDDHAGA